ncbi:hypothetical protein Q3G72_006671 [Acer saccharum]|nr:hypothetical protein Q3G72_006671 [Acer saccharum]
MNQLCLYLLNQCKTLKTVDHIHACLLKTGLFSNPYIFGKLLNHCSVTISDSLDYATRLFLHYPNPDVFMYNTLIRGFSESPRPQNSITTFIEMRRESSLFSSAAPDSFTFAFLLKAAAYGSLMTGMQLHCQALLHGLDGHLFVGTTLIITACFRGGDLESSERLFESMPFKDSTSWNLMLAGYAKAGEMEMVRKVFSEMEVKDDVSCSSMITALTQNGCFDEVFSVFMDLQRLGLRPNEVSLTGVLSACAQAGAFEFGRVVHGGTRLLKSNPCQNVEEYADDILKIIRMLEAERRKMYVSCIATSRQIFQAKDFTI